MRFFNQIGKPLSFELALVRHKAPPWGEVVPEIEDRHAVAVKLHGLPLATELHPDAPPLEEIDPADVPQDKPDESDIVKLLELAKAEGASNIELSNFEAKLRKLDRAELKEYLADIAAEAAREEAHDEEAERKAREAAALEAPIQPPPEPPPFGESEGDLADVPQDKPDESDIDVDVELDEGEDDGDDADSDEGEGTEGEETAAEGETTEGGAKPKRRRRKKKRAT